MAPLRPNGHGHLTRLGWSLILWSILWASVILFIAYKGYSFKSEQGKRNRAFITYVCHTENQRWGQLRDNLERVALVRRPGETDQEFAQRRKGTLALLDGLTNVPCHPQQN